MKHLISDTTKFKELQHNATKSREESLSTSLRKLRKDKIIDDALALLSWHYVKNKAIL